MKRFIRCPHCGNAQSYEIDTSIVKFYGGEYEFLKKECQKIQKRIDKLQYKHDYEDLSERKLDRVNDEMNALIKISDILKLIGKDGSKWVKPTYLV